MWDFGFDDTIVIFINLLLKIKMSTLFQQNVYNAVQKIPRSTVTTYAYLARYLGCNSAQAVGQALKRNPNAPEIPCHRVIASDLSIGGYSGATTGELIQKKIMLLRQEGVIVKNGKVAPSAVFDFSKLPPLIVSS